MIIVKHYDIAIIGGGPAGTTFARALATAQPKLKIALVNATPKTGSKVCGGLLAPDAQKVLAQFDLSLPKSILADPQIFDVKTMDIASRVSRSYQRHYLNMDRGKFDKWLLSLVPDSVDLVDGKCISIEPGFRLHIKTDQEHIHLESKYLVGADGGNSSVRRTFFAPPKKQYVAIQEYFPDTCTNLPHYSCIFDPETSDSCSWTIRKDGYWVFGGAFDKNNCRTAFEQQKSRLTSYLGINPGDPIKREACLLTSIRDARDFILGKDRVFLLGEAAGFVSPSSFEGFSSAFLSGKYLADAFAVCTDARSILRHYKRNTWKLRLKLLCKIPKMRILCSPFLRGLIMRSGIRSIQKYSEKGCLAKK